MNLLTDYFLYDIEQDNKLKKLVVYIIADKHIIGLVKLMQL